VGARSNYLQGLDESISWELFDAAPDATLVVAASGEVVFANELAGSMFGVSSDELLGRSVDSFLPAELRSAHRAHRNRYRARPEVRAMGVGLELRAVRPDGTAFDVEIALSPLHLADEALVVATVRDISARVAAEDRLHRVLRTLDASDDAMFIFDADTLAFSHVNEGAVRLVGYEVDDLLGMTPVHLNPTATSAEYREMVEHLLADPTAKIERQAVLLRRDGSEVPVEKTFQAAPVARDGTHWIIAVARDITARLRAAEELQRSQEALREAEQVVLLSEERDRIARDLHDTVIQRLFGVGLGLQSTAGRLDADSQARLDHAIDEIDAAIAELRHAIFSLQTSRRVPDGLRSRLLDVATEMTQAAGIEPRLQFEGPIDSLDPRIADHLVPVLREALSNVVHHAHATEVRVRVSVGDAVVLTVADDGIGLEGEVFGGRGVGNLQTRAMQLGGASTLCAGEGGGTVLEWQVPLRPPVDLRAADAEPSPTS
jgi:PAS domain S-box-containing protein